MKSFNQLKTEYEQLTGYRVGEMNNSNRFRIYKDQVLVKTITTSEMSYYIDLRQSTAKSTTKSTESTLVDNGKPMVDHKERWVVVSTKMRYLDSLKLKQLAKDNHHSTSHFIREQLEELIETGKA